MLFGVQYTNGSSKFFISFMIVQEISFSQGKVPEIIPSHFWCVEPFQSLLRGNKPPVNHATAYFQYLLSDKLKK